MFSVFLFLFIFFLLVSWQVFPIVCLHLCLVCNVASVFGLLVSLLHLAGKILFVTWFLDLLVSLLLLACNVASVLGLLVSFFLLACNVCSVASIFGLLISLLLLASNVANVLKSSFLFLFFVVVVFFLFFSSLFPSVSPLYLNTICAVDWELETKYLSAR